MTIRFILAFLLTLLGFALQIPAKATDFWDTPFQQPKGLRYWVVDSKTIPPTKLPTYGKYQTPSIGTYHAPESWFAFSAHFDDGLKARVPLDLLKAMNILPGNFDFHLAVIKSQGSSLRPHFWMHSKIPQKGSIVQHLSAKIWEQTDLTSLKELEIKKLTAINSHDDLLSPNNLHIQGVKPATSQLLWSVLTAGAVSKTSGGGISVKSKPIGSSIVTLHLMLNDTDFDAFRAPLNASTAPATLNGFLALENLTGGLKSLQDTLKALKEDTFVPTVTKFIPPKPKKKKKPAKKKPKAKKKPTAKKKPKRVKKKKAPAKPKKKTGKPKTKKKKALKKPSSKKKRKS